MVSQLSFVYPAKQLQRPVGVANTTVGALTSIVVLVGGRRELEHHGGGVGTAGVGIQVVVGVDGLVGDDLVTEEGRGGALVGYRVGRGVAGGPLGIRDGLARDLLHLVDLGVNGVAVVLVLRHHTGTGAGVTTASVENHHQVTLLQADIGGGRDGVAVKTITSRASRAAVSPKLVPH